MTDTTRENLQNQTQSKLEIQSHGELLIKFDTKLDAIISKLNAVEKRIEAMEGQKPLPLPKTPPTPARRLSHQCSENIYEELKKPSSSKAITIERKQGKFFTDEQRVFLTVSLQDVYQFIDKQPCKQQKHEKLKQMQSLKSIISAIAIQDPPAARRTSASAFAPSSTA